MSKNALGKGLGALFSESSADLKGDPNSLTKVSIELLKPNPYQPRKEFNEEALGELADSINQKGIIQPVVAEKQENGEYLIIAGERRVRAGKLAGLKEVPVVLKSFTIEEKIEIALIENIQREDLSALEEADGYRMMMEKLNLNQEEIAAKVGKNRTTVTNALRLLKLPDNIKEGMNQNPISPGHGRALLGVINPADQELVYNKIVAEGLSVRETERLVQELNRGIKLKSKAKKEDSPGKVLAPEMEEIKQKFIHAFGTKVNIKGSVKKGKIEISYLSMDDLERILEIIS